jgi:hypothetical protein
LVTIDLDHGAASASPGELDCHGGASVDKDRGLDRGLFIGRVD